jgi:hypothetical protein
MEVVLARGNQRLSGVPGVSIQGLGEEKPPLYHDPREEKLPLWHDDDKKVARSRCGCSGKDEDTNMTYRLLVVPL